MPILTQKKGLPPSPEGKPTKKVHIVEQGYQQMIRFNLLKNVYKILMNTAEKIPITKDNAKRGVAICPR